MNTLFIVLQYLVPQQLLSRLVGRAASSTLPWLKDSLIAPFIRRYGVDMSEAADPDPRNYPSFNAFFTRALREGARPIAEGKLDIACPADGAISQLGDIRDGRIFQAKGRDYSLIELLGGDREAAAPYANGSFATIYLSPKDYHRVHMPLDATLTSMSYVPGQLFSVNNTTAENVDRLFARNERVVCHFDTAAGPMAMVLVGAMIVAGVETVWAGQVAPPPRQITHTRYDQPQQPVTLKKGEEMGRFMLGSTVILLFGEERTRWLQQFEAGSATRMGEVMGEVLQGAEQPATEDAGEQIA